MVELVIDSFKCPKCGSLFPVEAHRERSRHFCFSENSFGRSYYVATIKVTCTTCKQEYFYIYTDGEHRFIEVAP